MRGNILMNKKGKLISVADSVQLSFAVDTYTYCSPRVNDSTSIGHREQEPFLDTTILRSTKKEKFN